MKQEQFEKLQQGMSDERLIILVENQIHELARSYGKSHKMSIPPMINDTDMLLGEMLRRYKLCVGK